MATFTDPSGQISLDVRVALRGMAWKYPCVAATTANITISTALNNGDTIDGVTLATGDHVLVKDQSTGSQNGIYIVGATPVRAYDMDQDQTTAVPAEEVRGAFVYVIGGTVNGGKLFHTTNVSVPTLGSTTITWAEWSTTPAAEAVIEHGAMGATETFDLADGHWHRGTLTANLTTTLIGFVAGTGDTLYVAVVQDGTGGWDITHDSSVVFTTADDQPGQSPGDVTWYAFWSVDGDSTIYGAILSSPPASLSTGTPALTLSTTNATGAASTVIATDATIAVFDATAPTTAAIGDSAATGSAGKAARRDHAHGMPSFGSPVAVGTANADGSAATIARSDHVHLGSTGGSHMHVVSEAHLSNGSSGAYTLDQAFEVGSVIAWNTTSLARLAVTEVQPDSATVSPVGSSGDTILFDYAATVI